MVADRAIFRERGWEEARRTPKERSDEDQTARDDEHKRAESIARSKRRARAAVYDIARSTDFKYFVTLTVDGAKLDRYDPGAVFAKLHRWLDNHVRRNGLAYLLIPEYHKDGALHFHAFFNGALEVKDSGTMSLPNHKKPVKVRSEAQRRALEAAGGVAVYNLPAWDFGFTSAIPLYGSREAAVRYVCKYISKGDAKIGGRWYYSGGELRRPSVTVADIDFNEAFARTGEAVHIDELGCELTMYEEEQDGIL